MWKLGSGDTGLGWRGEGGAFIIYRILSLERIFSVSQKDVVGAFCVSGRTGGTIKARNSVL